MQAKIHLCSRTQKTVVPSLPSLLCGCGLPSLLEAGGFLCQTCLPLLLELT